MVEAWKFIWCRQGLFFVVMIYHCRNKVIGRKKKEEVDIGMPNQWWRWDGILIPLSWTTSKTPHPHGFSVSFMYLYMLRHIYLFLVFGYNTHCTFCFFPLSYPIPLPMLLHQDWATFSPSFATNLEQPCLWPWGVL